MKLIIQIPAYNEEKTLPVTLSQLPVHVEGVDKVEYLVIDDGSSDRTEIVAKEHKVDHIIKIPVNSGLARAFKTGLDNSLMQGADIIVNTDADNQYCADDIQKLVKPIIMGEADIVIGERPISQIKHFSFFKKTLQRLGSWVVRRMSGTAIADAPSGFRAFSREAALRLNVISDYTYTLETIIQAGLTNIRITSVPIRVNSEKLRESHLIRSIPAYLYLSVKTIIRMFVFYKPLKFFVTIGLVLLLSAMALFFRFYFLVYFIGAVEGRTYLPSLITATGLLILACLTFVMGFLGDLLAHNRKLNEEALYRLKKIQLTFTQKDEKGVL